MRRRGHTADHGVRRYHTPNRRFNPVSNHQRRICPQMGMVGFKCILSASSESGARMGEGVCRSCVCDCIYEIADDSEARISYCVNVTTINRVGRVNDIARSVI